MANQIYGNKFNYENARRAYDAATDETERAKQQGIMNDAALSAKMLRENAQALGYDVSGVGADTSFEQATKNMAMARLQGINELIDMPSTQRQAADLYYDLRKNGKGMRESKAIANYMFDRYREDNVNKIMEGIGAYGINNDGSLNALGQMLLYKLAPESPTAANVVENGFALPKDTYQTASQFALNNANNWAAMQQVEKCRRNSRRKTGSRSTAI